MRLFNRVGVLVAADSREGARRIAAGVGGVVMCRNYQTLRRTDLASLSKRVFMVATCNHKDVHSSSFN